jgi:hypothetical protein
MWYETWCDTGEASAMRSQESGTRPARGTYMCLSP